MWRGVYLSPLIKVADEYSSDKQHQKKIYSNIMEKIYQFVFMYMVNPFKIRICQDKQEFWIVSGSSDKTIMMKKSDLIEF